MRNPLTRRSLMALLGAAALPRLGAQAPPLFEELPASKTGITWVHDNAMSPQRYIPESVGPGCAFLDFDNDGWMDIFLVNYGPCDFYKPEKPGKSALYRNNRDGTFTDVTEKAGVACNFFGMGVAAGDFDNDGFTDLLVTGYGRVILFRNNGDGTFTDITVKAGLGPDKLPSNWPTSAVWFDYDNDGKLDLFITNYVQFENAPGRYATCGDNKLGRNYYCVPRVFNPTRPMLFRNNGDGTFKLASTGTEIHSSLGKGLGVVATDINNDGLMDLWVSNDTSANFLFVNRGGGKWEEIGLSSQVAYNENGQARSGMGVDSADFNSDGLMDLYVANIDQEMFALYKNNGDETFTDVSHREGIAQASRQLSGWGLKFFDYDNDGHLDLFQSNSHPDDMIEMYSQAIKHKMPMLLFHQENGKLRNVSAEAGPIFQRPINARGLAVGDFNNDGLLDVLVASNGEPALLLKNNCRDGNGWVGMKLTGTTCNRDATGAWVTWSAGGVQRKRLLTSGGSYLSSHDPRVVLGCGKAPKIDWIEIKWPAPSKRVDRINNPPMNRYFKVEEGKGIV